MRFSRSTAIALSLLLVSGLLALFSLRGDSAIIDEIAHLPAGYSYVTRADMRLNPEHPPLVKDLAGLSVLLWSTVRHVQINFPTNVLSWSQWTNGEWVFGPDFLFLYNSVGKAMLFWGRLPTLLIFLGFGWFFFTWLRKRWGAATALLALFLYAFSPTVLAHARYVTTDMTATAAFFVSLAALLRWLEYPSAKTFWLAGFILGLAELVKFSLVLMIPVVLFLTGCWAALESAGTPARRMFRQLGQRLLAAVGILGIALGVIVVSYFIHTINYPIERQRLDAAESLAGKEPVWLRNVALWSVDKPVLRGLGHYVSGLLFVRDRTKFGSTTYFLGEVSNRGWRTYFPVLYLLKEPASLHLLTLVALIVWLAGFRHWRRIRWLGWVRQHFPELSFLVVIALYWLVSIQSELNIGVRHILPTFPFIFALVSLQLVRASQGLTKRWARIAKMSLGAVLLWQAVSVSHVYPSFLAYYNDLAGGPSQGHRYAVDSNLDWGQDYDRLQQFVQKRGIKEIGVDYFGGGRRWTVSARAYVHHAENPPVHGWLAVSYTLLMQERGRLAGGTWRPFNRYAWLDPYQPVAVIGHSIVVYDIP